MEPAAPAPEHAVQPLDGERKQVTVLFADVAGSMELAQGLDPEDWAGIMDRLFAVAAEGVERFGGTVDKFTGDGIMALFGAPAAQEDHARRACYAAIHLVDVAAAYAVELRRSHGLNLALRIGLNSGEVIAGRVGGARPSAYTAVGHTVGLAQRMEALAEPGTVYVTEDTARLVSGHFRLRNLGPFAVKGSAAPVGVHVLEGAGPRRRGMARWTVRSPLVGRADDLAVLTGALTRARAGTAQVVGVVGEPGVGKSRLCEEFARVAAAEGITVRRASGFSHTSGIPLVPVLELLRDYFGIAEADSPAAAREKVAGRLLLLDSAFEEALPLLFDFLDVPDPDRPAPRLAADARLRRIFDVLRRLTRRRGEAETVVILLEDLHWWDPQSDAFLADLIALFPGTRTVVVANFRPEYDAPWMRHSFFHRLPVNPLSADATTELLEALLGPHPSVGPLTTQIAERTGGNPFFVEEVVRSLVEDGSLAGAPGAYLLTRPPTEVRVPPTVQATLGARIDRLGDRDKELLQTAAVIGRSFPEAVLAAVSGRPDDDLAAGLRRLCEAEFLQEEAAWPVAEFRFWHVLTAEVAYSTLLVDRRRRLHATVATALADLDPARIDERAALIASHYERAGSDLEWARWEERAASWSQRRDFSEAVARWRSVLDILDGLPESEDALNTGVRVRAQLIRTGGRVGLAPEETERFFLEGEALARRCADTTLGVLVQFSRGSDLFVRGQVAASNEAYGRARQMAAGTGDASLQGVASVGYVYQAYVSALPAFRRALDEVVEALTQREDLELGAREIGYSPLIRAMQYRAEVLALAGRLTEARVEGERTLSLARERDQTEMVPWELADLARMAELTGEPGEALESAAAAVSLTEESGNIVIQIIAQHGLAVAEQLAGRPERAEAVLTKVLAQARAHRTGLFDEGYLLARLATARLAQGDTAGARSLVDEAVEVTRRQGAPVVECFALLIRARVLRASGEEAQAAALADVDAGLALAAQVGAVAYAALLEEEQARLLRDGDRLAAVLHRYRVIGATGHARRIEAELAGAIDSTG